MCARHGAKQIIGGVKVVVIERRPWSLLPPLSKRSGLHFKGPCRRLLTCQRKLCVCEIVGSDKKVVRFVRQLFSGTREIHDAVDNHDDNVDTGRPEVASHGLGEAALSGFGWGEGGGHDTPTTGGRGSDKDDVPGSPFLHAGDDLLCGHIRPPCCRSSAKTDSTQRGAPSLPPLAFEAPHRQRR